MWNKQVKCATCRHYIDKKEAQEVRTDYTGLSPLRWEPMFVYFCPMHSVPYTRVDNFYGQNSATYFKEFVVDCMTGEPIGYKRIKNENHE